MTEQLGPGVPRPDRQYPARPILGVGAVVVNGREVLVVQRGAEPGYGQWSIPGGAVELGETVREAAAREVAEECSIAIDVVDVIEVIERVMLDKDGRVEYHYVLLDFAARYKSGELRAGSDVLAARWVPVSALEGVGLPQITLAVIHKALARLEVT